MGEGLVVLTQAVVVIVSCVDKQALPINISEAGCNEQSYCCIEKVTQLYGAPFNHVLC